MPTLNIYVARVPRKIDNKYKVSIRITQHKEHAYFDTGLYVVKGQVTRDFRLKDKYVLSTVLDKIKECEDIL